MLKILNNTDNAEWQQSAHDRYVSYHDAVEHLSQRRQHTWIAQLLSPTRPTCENMMQ